MKQFAPTVDSKELNVEGLCIQRDRKTILDNIRLRLSPGEQVAVIGPNGSGKSTLLRVLSGNLRPTTGQVTLNGESLPKISARDLCRKITFVPQEIPVAFGFTVREFLRLGQETALEADFKSRTAQSLILSVREAISHRENATTISQQQVSDGAVTNPLRPINGHLGESRRFPSGFADRRESPEFHATQANLSEIRRVKGPIYQNAALLETFELAGRLDQNLLTLSGGERQRAAIVRALCQNTPFLLLDEPTAHLDLRFQQRLMVMLQEQTRQNQTGVLIVLHDLNLAANADRILLLDNGRIVAEGNPATVLTPANLQPVYQTALDIVTNPDTGQIFVHFPKN